MKNTETHLNEAVEKVKEFLEKKGCDCEIFYTRDTIFTVEDASRAVGVPPEEILKSLMLLVDGIPVLALMSGTNRVDLKKIKRFLNARKVRMADPGYVYDYSGYRIGGVPPVGYPDRLTTLIDEDLFNFPTVWAAAGNDHSFFPVRPSKLLEITYGDKCDIRKE
ncbi:MAG: YbaK/EbsC family protein [Synergistales bacterium]|nr:YbaK/EbsC family protein [Synergistales bacterium]